MNRCPVVLDCARMTSTPSPDTNPLCKPTAASCENAVRQGSCDSQASNAAIPRMSTNKTSPNSLRAYAADLARRRILSQSKLQLQAKERMFTPNQALKALNDEATWNKGEEASLRREVETMHAAYREQLVRNQELESAMLLSEQEMKRRFEECLAAAEENHCCEVAKLKNMLMESKTKMEELEEHRTTQDKMQQDMTAAKETIAMLKMQLTHEQERRAGFAKFSMAVELLLLIATCVFAAEALVK